MAEDAERGLTDEKVASLVLSLTQVAAELHPQPPQKLIELFLSRAKAEPEAIRHHTPNPAAFYRMCRLVAQRGNPKMSELSSAVSIPISTVSRWADWMIEDGLACRTTDPQDRRIVRIGLTETGHRLLEAIEKRMAENARKMLDCLTVEEQTVLLVMFDKVARGLQGAEE
jgi:DNA-binding MarR family transcriptional regulator